MMGKFLRDFHKLAWNHLWIYWVENVEKDGEKCTGSVDS